MNDHQRRDGGVVAGMLLGLVSGLLMGGPLAWLVSHTTERSVWKVVGVAAAIVTLDAGSVLERDHFVDFPMAEPLLNSSMVQVDASPRFVGRATSVPLSLGVPLSWSLIEPTDPTCVDDLSVLLADAGVNAPADSKRVLEALKARLAP